MDQVVLAIVFDELVGVGFDLAGAVGVGLGFAGAGELLGVGLVAAGMRRRMAGKLGVPRPVTGSQPTVAAKPVVPQPLELPITTSFSPWHPCVYSHGFRKPSAGKPRDIRSSFRSAITDAKVGAAADDPPTWTCMPRHVIKYLEP